MQQNGLHQSSYRDGAVAPCPVKGHRSTLSDPGTVGTEPRTRDQPALIPPPPVRCVRSVRVEERVSEVLASKMESSAKQVTLEGISGEQTEDYRVVFL